MQRLIIMRNALLLACLLAVSHAWTTLSLSSSSSFLPLPLVTPQRRPCRTTARRTVTNLHLFYQPPPVKNGVTTTTTTRRLFLPETVSLDWNEGRVKFPYKFPVSVGKQPVFTSSPPKENGTLTIRLMEWKDLEQITDICVREYSTYSTPVLETSSPWVKFTDWLDQMTLGPYVKLSMILKLLLDYSLPKLPDDHAVLVASLREPGNDDKEKEEIVGMVEVSRQPPLPERNPPAIPFPLALKEAYCRTFLNTSTQGWITNLLIVPEYRGRGWAKALVMACEGIARCWSTTSIHLHCDASYRVPQKLYRSLGYEPFSSVVPDRYAWMSNNDYCQSSIYVIDGVPLLYLCKILL